MCLDMANALKSIVQPSVKCVSAPGALIVQMLAQTKRVCEIGLRLAETKAFAKLAQGNGDEVP
jgi:hypothetical protein